MTKCLLYRADSVTSEWTDYRKKRPFGAHRLMSFLWSIGCRVSNDITRQTTAIRTKIRTVETTTRRNDRNGDEKPSVAAFIFQLVGLLQSDGPICLSQLMNCFYWLACLPHGCSGWAEYFRNLALFPLLTRASPDSAQTSSIINGHQRVTNHSRNFLPERNLVVT